MPFGQKKKCIFESKRIRVAEKLKNRVRTDLVNTNFSISSTSDNVIATSNLNLNLEKIFIFPSHQPTQNASNQLNHTNHSSLIII